MKFQALLLGKLNEKYSFILDSQNKMTIQVDIIQLLLHNYLQSPYNQLLPLNLFVRNLSGSVISPSFIIYLNITETFCLIGMTGSFANLMCAKLLVKTYQYINCCTNIPKLYFFRPRYSKYLDIFNVCLNLL